MTVDALKALDGEMFPAPWPTDWLYEVVRHGQRNMDIESYEMPGWEGPNRYDGTPLAKLRNALPALIEVVEAAREVDDEAEPTMRAMRLHAALGTLRRALGGLERDSE